MNWLFELIQNYKNQYESRAEWNSIICKITEICDIFFSYELWYLHQANIIYVCIFEVMNAIWFGCFSL